LPGFEVVAEQAQEQPSVIVNHDTGDVRWSPTAPTLTWRGAVRGALSIGGVRLSLAALSTVSSPMPYRLVAGPEWPVPSNSPQPGVVPPTLDPGFLEPSPAPRPTPLSDVAMFGHRESGIVTLELSPAELGVTGVLMPGSQLVLRLSLAHPGVVGYIRTHKPIGHVDIEVLLLDSGRSPVMWGGGPVRLAGRFQVK
jgi:hypothetical protein